MKLHKASDFVNEDIKPDFNVDPNSKMFDFETRNIIGEITIYINKALKAKNQKFFDDMNELLKKYPDYAHKTPPSGTNIIGREGLEGTVENFTNFTK